MHKVSNVQSDESMKRPIGEAVDDNVAMRAIRLNQKSHHTHAARSPVAHDEPGVLTIGRQDTSKQQRALPNLN